MANVIKRVSFLAGPPHGGPIGAGRERNYIKREDYYQAGSACRMADSFTLSARWIFPVAGAPLEEGTISVKHGCIEVIERRGIRRPDLDLGNVAILPGLVNPHTHLDLSGLRGRAQPSQDFLQWLRAVIYHRRSLSPEQASKDIQA